MTFTFVDYQFFAYIALAFLAGIVFWDFVTLYQHHVHEKGMCRREFWKRVWRDINGDGFGNREIRSEKHYTSK